MKARPDKTLADYLAIAATPLLIMVFVGSLMFFLQSLFYQGGHESRVKWILFWFVLGQVLIARIAIESGRAHASIFTLGLGVAVSLTVFKFIPEGQLLVIGSLGLVWWMTDKLTWDCTLIDESEDSSGEGLLQIAGVADGAELNSGSNPASEHEANRDERIPLWRRLFMNEGERAGKPHAPGLWVIYFSMVALPLFGLGQAGWLTSRRLDRDFSFRCLFAYVAAGLGLLLLTSLLGLRRYLRQRGLQMPGAMAATWVGMGGIIATVILFGSLLLPQPESDVALNALIDKVSQQVQRASDRAVVKSDGVRDPEMQGQAPANPQQQAGQQQAGQQQAGQQQAPQTPPPAVPNSTVSAGMLVKLIAYGLIASALMYFLFRHWTAVMSFLRQFWNELLGLFGRRAEVAVEDPAQSEVAPLRVVLFSDFEHPFRSGMARQKSVSELVQYTFEALQAWASEHDCPRTQDQTPMEFGQHLLAESFELSVDANEFTQVYSRIAYARQAPESSAVPLMQRLWDRMTSLSKKTA